MVDPDPREVKQSATSYHLLMGEIGRLVLHTRACEREQKRGLAGQRLRTDLERSLRGHT